MKQFGIFWIGGTGTVLIDIRTLEEFWTFGLGGVETVWEVYNLKAMEVVHRWGVRIICAENCSYGVEISSFCIVIKICVSNRNE